MDSRQTIAVFALLQMTFIVCLGQTAHHPVEDDFELIVKRLEHQESSDEWDHKDERAEVGNSEDQSDEIRERYLDGDYRKKRQIDVQGGLTPAQKDKVVEVHNVLRRGEGSSNMQVLKYSERLGQLAQEWANRCNWGHRPQQSFVASDYGVKSVGENLWASSGTDLRIIPEKPIQDWFDEKSGFVYDSNSCARQPCGHYTAVVWADTTEVGCGLATCPVLQSSGMRNAQFFVCNYGPAGNMMGQKPFKKGTPCSECSSGQFFCTEGMCDHTCRQAARGGGKCECKSSCQNGSPTPDCKCRCNAGYSGVRCNERCADKNPQCGANPGWPVSFCHDKTIFGGIMYDQVNEQCPKMCGKCQ